MNPNPNPPAVGQRASREGDPCPVWCAVDHETPYGTTPGGRELYLEAHVSAPVGSDSVPQVRLSLLGQRHDARVTVTAPGTPRLALGADQAEALAAILGVTGLDGAALADELRAAAAIARETAQ